MNTDTDKYLKALESKQKQEDLTPWKKGSILDENHM